MRLLRIPCAAACLLLAAAPLTAQQAPARLPPDTARVPGQMGPGARLQKGLVGILAEQPELLSLTSSQQRRAGELASRLLERNGAIHAQMMQITGGPQSGSTGPAARQERMSRRGQVLPLLDDMRANDRAATDSLRMVLNDNQRVRLDSLRADFLIRVAGGPMAAGGRGMRAGPGRAQMGRGGRMSHRGCRGC